MRKCLRWLVLAAVLAALFCCSSAMAAGGTDGNITWNLDDNGVLTISGSGTMKDYSIKEMNGDYITTAPWGVSANSVVIEDGVTSIGRMAFDGCISLTSITIPDSMTSIGDYAFYRCSSLTSITIPDGVTSTGNYAFCNCTSLASITIPDGVTSIGNNAFNNCTSLTSITIPDSVTSIGGGAFSICSSLTSIMIPDGVTSIGDYAFAYCSSLTSIAIPDGVTSIGDWAFVNCSSLTSITIPESVNSIGISAFAGCSGLTSITIPDGVTSIGENAFYGCESLTSITLPDSVTSIGDYAFYRCSSLTSITIPDGVTSIGDGAFAGCSSLTSITIPSSVTSIGVYVFNNSGLSKLWWESDEEIAVGIKAIPAGTTIYCYEFTPLETWATDAGYPVVLIDNIQQEDLPVVSVPDAVRLDIGTTRQLPVGILPPSTDYVITWAVDDPAIGTVSAEGLFTALSAGTANITVTVDGKALTYPVTVVRPATSLAIPEIWVVAKQTCQAVPVITPVDANLDLSWGTYNNTYAVVHKNGLVTGKAVGETQLWVSDSISGLYAETTVHSCDPVTAVAFAEETAVVQPGSTVALTANVTMRTQSCVNHLVTFASSDETIATVDADGTVHGIAPGTVTITATAVNSSDISASCVVTVRGLNVLTLPEGLTTIESGAFTGLPGVDAIRLPAGITTIAPDAFDPGVTLYVPSADWLQWAGDNGYNGTLE
ncbi:MAG: leucine-rich repeat protein [Clostridia bacterium]|nr:leucine-rich repeat protein [Clostridia bacterium]